MLTVFDLELRTTEFGKAVIRLCRDLPTNSMNERLVGQVVGSAGSVGANYREAKEALHWLELIQEANPERKAPIAELIREGRELKNILSAIIQKAER